MISRCFPVAAPLPVGGLVVPVQQLRLRDLATIEAWSVLALPRPGDGLDPDSPSFEADLRAAHRAAERWPPGLDSPEVAELAFGTPEGRAVVLGCVLRGLGLAPADLRALADSATEAEWAAVMDAAFARDPSPYQRLTAIVDAMAGVEPFEPREGGVPVSWAQAIAEECEGDPGRWEAVGDLTLGQWRVYRSGGAPWERHDPLPEGAEETRRIQALRAAWWAREGEATAAAASAPPAPSRPRKRRATRK